MYCVATTMDPETFLASTYAATRIKPFANRVLVEQLYHGWWIRPNFNLANRKDAALNIISCKQADIVLDRQENRTNARGFKLMVRDTGPGEYLVKVYYFFRHSYCCFLCWFLLFSMVIVVIVFVVTFAILRVPQNSLRDTKIKRQKIRTTTNFVAPSHLIRDTFKIILLSPLLSLSSLVIAPFSQ